MCTMRKIILMSAILIFLTSCGRNELEQTDTRAYEDTHIYKETPVTEVEPLPPEQHEPKELPAYEAHSLETVINAIADLIRSDFVEFDENLIEWPQFISVLAANRFPPHLIHYDIWRASWEAFLPEIVYAFHDINGDGVPELILGQIGFGQLTIEAVYSLQNGIPTLLLDVFLDDFIGLVENNYGLGIIYHGWSPFPGGIYGAFYYSIDENGFLIEKGGTMHTIWNQVGSIHDYEDLDCIFEKYEPEFFLFTSGFLGEDFGEKIPITEEEAREFRSRIGLRGDTMRVVLDWRPVLP